MKIMEFFQSGRKFSMSRLVTFGALISGMYVMVRMALGDFTPNLSGSLMFTAFLRTDAAVMFSAGTSKLAKIRM